jgi:diguanylate cyclase (GGDEF)-like protein/PAS domain S-box-containing protein
MKAGFGAGFALLLGIAIAAGLQTLQWEESSRAVAVAQNVIERIAELSFESQDADDSARRFITTLDRLDLARCREALRQTEERESEIEVLVAENSGQRKISQSVYRLVSSQTDTLFAALAAVDMSSGDVSAVRAAIQTLDRSGLSLELRAALLELESEERRGLRFSTEWQRSAAGTSRILFAVTSIFSVGLIVIAGWRMSAEQNRRAEVEKTLIAKEEQYRRVVELAGDMIYRTDAEGRFTFCNQALFNLLHFSKAEVLGRSYLKFIRQDKRRAAERFYIRQYGRKQKNSYYEFPIVDGHGRERWVGQNAQLVMEGEKILGFQAIAREITERKRVEQELQKSRGFIERIAATMPGVLYVYDIVEGRNLYSNREVQNLLGFKPEDINEAIHSGQLVLHPDDRPMMQAHHEAMRHAPDGEVRRIEYRLRHVDGQWVWLLGRTTPFQRGTDGLVTQVVTIAQDITSRKEAQDKLTWQANYDALTGLSNRHHFFTGLQSLLRRAGIEHAVVSLCIFDIDFFKAINDHHGHASGDEVLEEVGNIVRAELRAIDVAGRLGGDEFCFALPRTDANECARVAERIRERLATLAFGMNSGSAFSVSATFGVAESEARIDAKALMEVADRALYRAKSAGRNRVVVDI